MREPERVRRDEGAGGRHRHGEVGGDQVDHPDDEHLGAAHHERAGEQDGQHPPWPGLRCSGRGHVASLVYLQLDSCRFAREVQPLNCSLVFEAPDMGIRFDLDRPTLRFHGI